MARFLTDPIFGHDGIRSRLDDAAVIDAMVRVEVELARVQAGLGMVPEASAVAIAEALASVEVDPDALGRGMRAAGVPVPALLKELRSKLDPADADWLHYGATSQDIIDTALCLCFDVALSDLEASLDRLIDLLEEHSIAHTNTRMLARTRGQLATPITFGLRLATWAQPLIALEAELSSLRQAALRVSLGGASGSRNSFGGQGAALASNLADALGLADSAPWHTDRTGFQRLGNWLVGLINALAKIGQDFAIACRGEVGELRPASGGGSSTMPHKSNPVQAEALQSLAAMSVACQTGLTASAVHAEERDGAMWPVEWTFLPMLFEAAGAGLDRAQSLIGSMHVDVGTMRARIDAAPEVKAEAAVFALAPRVGRVEAARIVKEALAEGNLLSALAQNFPDIDWIAALSDAAFTGPAADTARRIFAERKNDTNRH